MSATPMNAVPEGPVRPTFAPLLLAFGTSFLFAGITMHWLFAAVGAVVTAEALRRWMAEIMRQWRDGDEGAALHTTPGASKEAP